MAKRHQVDSGDATVSDLQIFYLQKDPSSWLTKSSAVLDQANADMSKALGESQAAASRASTISLIFIVLGTLCAMIFVGITAVRTAQSITEPLQHLIAVAREIGDSGDLDQNIDIHRSDEIGALATTFNNMVAYLKEMATVSMAVAEGDLTIEVAPRSNGILWVTRFSVCRTGFSKSSVPRVTALHRFPQDRTRWQVLLTNQPKSASKLPPPLKK